MPAATPALYPPNFTTSHTPATPDALWVVVVSNQLDAPTRSAFKQTVLDQLDAGFRKIVFDLSQCGYLDSRALGTLVSIASAVSRHKATFAVCALNADLRTLMRLTRLDHVLTICDTVDEALVTVDAGVPS